MNRDTFASQKDLKIIGKLKAKLQGCPKCHKDDECGCEACISRFGPRSGVYYSIIDNNQICGHCGYSAHYGVWEDRNYLMILIQGGFSGLEKYSIKDLLQRYKEVKRFERKHSQSARKEAHHVRT